MRSKNHAHMSVDHWLPPASPYGRNESELPEGNSELRHCRVAFRQAVSSSWGVVSWYRNLAERSCLPTTLEVRCYISLVVKIQIQKGKSTSLTASTVRWCSYSFSSSASHAAGSCPWYQTRNHAVNCDQRSCVNSHHIQAIWSTADTIGVFFSSGAFQSMSLRLVELALNRTCYSLKEEARQIFPAWSTTVTTYRLVSQVV